MADPDGGEDGPEASRLAEASFLDEPMEEDQLLAEEGILGNESGSAVHGI
ncbi:MAG: hypothetical protein ABSF61_00600 [Anaerolineales bacterium]|jgi:hypothetical protein